MDRDQQSAGVDSSYAWLRLVASLLLATIGGVGIWSSVVVLPAVQAEFAVARSSASIPYTATLIGFATGGILMGRLADRFGIVVPIIIGACALGAGYVGASMATTLWQFTIAQCVLVGLLGSSATFGPLVADVSYWFVRRRGTAIGICASGNYLAGTIWPPFIQHFVESVGWRQTYAVVGIVCVVTMLPLALALRRRPPHQQGIRQPSTPADLGRRERERVFAPQTLQALLVLAGISCCVAMSMPQVHIVAYCGDLGYGVARGAEMLSIMLGTGVISRLGSGWISDRIGGLRTLLLGSVLQCLTLMLYIPFNGLMSLYVVSALFGLSQGGIVPSYAMIIREYLPPQEAGARVGMVLMSTIVGMALGGWLTGVIFDVTGSYQVAFLHGILWNLLNLAIALWLLFKQRARFAPA